MALRSPRAPAPTSGTLPDRRLIALVAAWVADGLISEEQGRRILARTPGSPAARSGNSSLVAEALGYLGGVVVLVGAILVGTRYWTEIGVPARLAVLGGVTTGLVIAGFAVAPRLGPTAHRLRAVLWAASLASLMATLVVLALDVLGLSGQAVFLVATTGTSMLGLLLYRRDPSFLMQIATGAAVVVAAGCAAAVWVEPETTPGVAVWAIGAAWALLGWGEVLTPRRAVMAVGGVVMIIGGMFTIQHDLGVLATLLTVALLVVVSLVTRDPLMLAVGALGAFQVLPVAVQRWLPDSVVAPLALVMLGLALVGLAALLVRRQPAPLRDVSTVIHRRTAIVAATAILIAALPVIAAIGVATS